MEVSVNEHLGAKIEDEKEIGAVAERLSRINERLAIRNRRSRRVWLGIVIVLSAFALTGIILLVLSLISFFTVRNVETSAETYPQEIGAVPDAPNTLPISIMLDGVLYVRTGETDYDTFDESEILGYISSQIPLTAWPSENFQTNFESLNGEPYAAFDGGYAVRFHRGDGHKWMLFNKLEDVLAKETNGGLRLGFYYSEDGLSWVRLEEGRSFSFNRYIALSYLPNGEYSVADGVLTLEAGNDEKYSFIIKNDGLELELKHTYIEGLLEEGMRFKYSGENAR